METSNVCDREFNNLSLDPPALGKGCALFKCLMSRVFRQFPIVPGDYNVFGVYLEGTHVL